MSTNKNLNPNIFSYKEVWERITKETDIKVQKDLARVIGLSQGTISGWKQKDIWPIEWAFKIYREYGYLTEWILTGEGPKKLDERVRGQEINFEILTELNEWLTEYAAKEPFRREWFRGLIEDTFPHFRAWKKRKDQEEGIDNSDSTYKVA